MFPTLWQQSVSVGRFKHDDASVHKVRSIKQWIVEFAIDELDWFVLRHL